MFGRVLRLAGLLLAGALIWAAPAQAQFSEGYKFLEAVKKKNGEEVTEALNKPGSTMINTRDLTSGESALHIVTARRDLTWMNFLLSRGANVNARDARGVTPLVMAVNLGFIEGVELLISKNARLDDANSAGETPLISAVHNRNIGLMRALLKAGADPDRNDNSGRSARDYATLEGKNSVMLNEIESNAKPRSQRQQARPSYGPTL